MSTADEDATEWEAIARRELAEHHRRFFEEEVESHFSAYLAELREPGRPAAEREALLKFVHRLTTASEFLVDDAEEVGAIDTDGAETLGEGVRALSSAAMVVGDRELGDADTDRARFEESVDAVDNAE